MPNWTELLSLAAVVGAAATLIGYTGRAFRWLHRSAEQDRELRCIRGEQEILCKALSACLDGLIQLGANHDVPKMKKELDDHIRSQAHR